MGVGVFSVDGIDQFETDTPAGVSAAPRYGLLRLRAAAVPSAPHT